MKKVLYYVILIAIFFALDFAIIVGFSFAGWKPGGIIFNALLIMTFMITAGMSKYVKKWMGIEDKKETKNEEKDDVYNLAGSKIKSNATYDDLKALPRGIYIFGGKKILVP